MGNVSLVFIYINIVITSILLWLITFVGYITNKKFYKKNEKSIYECGFKSTTNTNITLSINSILSAIFLILYEVEFIMLIPYIFNTTLVTVGSFTTVIMFVAFIIISFFLDIIADSVNWVY